MVMLIQKLKSPKSKKKRRKKLNYGPLQLGPTDNKKHWKIKNHMKNFKNKEKFIIGYFPTSKLQWIYSSLINNTILVGQH